jgi:hypothetical protein
MTATPAPVPTPSPASSVVVLSPIDDAYVAEGSPSANFGSDVLLQTDTGPVFESYLKFDLQSLGGPSISSATLRMWVMNASTSPNQIKNVSDNSWTESTITFANKPAKGATITGFTPNGGTGAWEEVLITSAVTAGAGSLMSIAIDTAGTDGFQFSSSEAATNRVELVIVLGAAVRPTPAVVGQPDDLPSTGGSPTAGAEYWPWFLAGAIGALVLLGVVALKVRPGRMQDATRQGTATATIRGTTAAEGSSSLALLAAAFGIAVVCGVGFLIARSDSRR